MAKGYSKSKAFREKVHTVLSEYKKGSLHSGPGDKHLAKSRKQAIAIALSEARKKTGM